MFLCVERIYKMAKKLLCLFLTLIIISALVPPTAVLADGSEAPISAADSVTLDDIIKAASGIIRQNEGNYNSVSPDDNGALSIGWIQWHANRALNLLKDIVNANPSQALEILGETLYNEIMTAQSWSTRILTKEEAGVISILISTKEGMKAQDDLAAKDISSYINRAIGLGIKDPAALVYYADVENQCGSGGSKRVAAAAAVLAGSYEAITLEHMHEAAMADSIAGGKHSTRRQRTYNNCLLLDWEIIGTKLEVWDIISARNVREKPDTSSPLVTTIAKGTKVIITEKALFGTQTRGKTSMGWITLDSASCALNETLTGGYVFAPVIFDTNGGSFGSDHKSSIAINGINCPRSADTIIVYDSDYPQATTPTNEYGAEAAVGADGIVISSPTYGTCKTEIPKGGFVLSGIGKGYTSLASNVKVGNYVRFEKDSMTLFIYESYAAYLDLRKAETTATALNTSRPANSLILYNKDYAFKAPQTNEYGTEVAVDADGKVLNAPSYGLCKTPIPEGGFVLSGIGSGYTWLSRNVKAGDYIHFDSESKTITVYSDKDKLIAQTKTTAMNSPYGILPSPKKSGWAFNGWYIGTPDKKIQPEDICSSPFCITLTADWTMTGDRIVLDTNGGTFTGTSVGTLSGINTYRPADSLILYNNDYTATTTPTNEFGAEAAVGADGIVISAPTYGTCKTEIPEGGFVLSGIGTGYDWLSKNVKVGSYVIFDSEKNTVTVYESKSTYDSLNKIVLPGSPIGTLPEAQREYHKFLGWFTAGGDRVTENTLMPKGGLNLIAKWEVLPGKLTLDFDGAVADGLISSADIAGTNITRGANSLVVYKDKASTGTNVYGSEAIILNNGTVLSVFPYGAGNTKIPAGAYAISGIGTMHTWLQNNVSQGNYVEIKNGKIFVWKNRACANAPTVSDSVKFGEKYPTLPTVTKNGYIFLGWQDRAGNTVNSGDSVMQYGDVTLTAKWEKLSVVTFNAGSGKLLAAAPKATAAGINITRGANSLVIYAGKASTQTNIYGSEAVVDASGKVLAVYPYGTGNTKIPEGGFVLSGIGTMHTWLQTNVKVGGYVTLRGYTVTAYESAEALDAIDGTLYIKSGSALPSLPAATLSGKAFVAWTDGEGKEYKAGSTISADITLTAKWSATEATLIYDTQGGSFAPAKGSCKLNGTNVARPGNSLILYNSSYSNSYPNTNAYGTEVAVDKNGTVLSSPVYGSCKTPIPEGGFVLSGIGTGYTWLRENVKAGNYIRLDGDTVTVFESYDDYLAAEKKVIAVGKTYGPLPTPKKEGFLFAGWKDSDGNKISEGTTVTDCENPVIFAAWSTPVTVTFDAAGGSMVYATATLNGTNISRGANCLVLYKNRTSTGTNIYGTEAIVNSDGQVIATYGYGKGNASIPEGCFALSGNGNMSDWIAKNVTKGSYVFIEGNTVKVYKNKLSCEASKGSITLPKDSLLAILPVPSRDEAAFAGWKTSDGSIFTEGTVITESITLTAKWTASSAELIFNTNGGAFMPAKGSYTLNGTNVSRPGNSIILYNSSYSSSYPNTNAYGTEIAVDKNGMVLASPVYGACKTPIPAGGFVLSGIGTGYTWLRENVKAGNYIHLDPASNTVTVYESYNDYLGSAGKRISLGKAYGTLPTPKREGFLFMGWQDHNGNIISESTVVLSCDIPVVTAIWKKPVTITFDVKGGSYIFAKSTLSGTNVTRGANQLILYKDKASTGTNIYGSEAIIDSEGKVIATYGYGKGNNPIPEGCFALSGNGKMSEWISSNISVGCYVTVSGKTVSVYKNKTAMLAAGGSVTIPEGSCLCELPTPTKYGYNFGGWQDSSGNIIATGAPFDQSKTITAVWTAKSVTVTFDADGGWLSPVATYTANGKNMYRGTGKLIIYDEGASTGTNIYGTEVIVNAKGIVTEIRPYGYCDAPIPDGGFVLSGHDGGADWLKANVAVGDTVKLSGLNISVYKAGKSSTLEKSAAFGSPLGTLPTPEKEGATFLGWYSTDGTRVTQNTLLTLSDSKLTLIAKWG